MSNDGKRVVDCIIERMPDIENENVLKSIGLIIGDCAVMITEMKEQIGYSILFINL